MLTEPIYGQINGLPGFRGKLVAIADSGMGAIIDQQEQVIFGHKDWFVPDSTEDAIRLAYVRKPKPMADKRLAEFQDEQAFLDNLK